MNFVEKIIGTGGIRSACQPIVQIDGPKLIVNSVELLTLLPEDSLIRNAATLYDHARRCEAEPQLDRYCATVALEAARSLPEPLGLSFDVQLATLEEDMGFAGHVSEAAARFDLDNSDIMLEVVEHAPPWNGPALQVAVRELRSAGFSIALDGIGGGTASHRMILEVRPNCLKIDRYLIHACHKDGLRRAMLKSLGCLAREIGATIIAVGVENEREVETLADLGIDLFQGDFLFPAIPTNTLEKLLSPGRGIPVEIRRPLGVRISEAVIRS